MVRAIKDLYQQTAPRRGLHRNAWHRLARRIRSWWRYELISLFNHSDKTPAFVVLIVVLRIFLLVVFLRSSISGSFALTTSVTYCNDSDGD